MQSRFGYFHGLVLFSVTGCCCSFKLGPKETILTYKLIMEEIVLVLGPQEIVLILDLVN